MVSSDMAGVLGQLDMIIIVVCCEVRHEMFLDAVLAKLHRRG